MPQTLEQWDQTIGHHLRMIRHHAASIETHVAYMQRQPEFETMAEDELRKVDAALAIAIGRVQHALHEFRSKPRDT